MVDIWEWLMTTDSPLFLLVLYLAGALVLFTTWVIVKGILWLDVVKKRNKKQKECSKKYNQSWFCRPTPANPHKPSYGGGKYTDNSQSNSQARRLHKPIISKPKRKKQPKANRTMFDTLIATRVDFKSEITLQKNGV